LAWESSGVVVVMVVRGRNFIYTFLFRLDPTSGKITEAFSIHYRSVQQADENLMSC